MVVKTWLRPENKVWWFRLGSGQKTKYGFPDVAPARGQNMVVQTCHEREKNVNQTLIPAGAKVLVSIFLLKL